MNIGIIVQARNNSQRLPEKVTLPFYQDQSILEIILKKLKLTKYPVIVATTRQKQDNKIIQISKKENVLFFRGNEKNVLERFINCANKFKLSHIIRVCADNPFINIELISELIDSKSDYAVHFINNQPSIKTHWGIFSEFVTLKSLKKIQELTKNKIYQEHVTNYIYENPQKFIIKKLDPPKECLNKKVRLTVDTEEDFKITQKIYNNCIKNQSDFNLNTIINQINSELEKKMIELIKSNQK